MNHSFAHKIIKLLFLEKKIKQTMINTCQCKCGNIVISGCVMKQKDVQIVFNKQDLLIGSELTNYLEVRNNAIRIKDWNQIDHIKCKNESIIIYCRQCHHSIHIVHRNNRFYAAYLNENKSKIHRRQSVPLHEDTRQKVRSSIFSVLFQTTDSEDIGYDNENAETKDIDTSFLDIDDSDFEYMFSAKGIPFVGSFTDRFVDLQTDSLIV